MTSDLENRTQRALRPVDPGEDFTQRLLARVAAEPALPRRRAVPKLVWFPAALAASLILAIVVRHENQERREQSGLAARAKVLEALRVTSAKLDLAYQLVNMPVAPQPSGDTGV